MLRLSSWKMKITRAARDVLAVWMSLRVPGVPWQAKALALASVLYLALPVDIIPDIIPVAGWLDDLAMVPLLGYLASRLIPHDAMRELRSRADTVLLRLGPGFTRLAVGFVVVWLFLAVLGGIMFYRSWRDKNEENHGRYRREVTLPASIVVP